jgi:hypothetical protein
LIPYDAFTEFWNGSFSDLQNSQTHWKVIGEQPFKDFYPQTTQPTPKPQKTDCYLFAKIYLVYIPVIFSN